MCVCVCVCVITQVVADTHTHTHTHTHHTHRSGSPPHHSCSSYFPGPIRVVPAYVTGISRQAAPQHGARRQILLPNYWERGGPLPITLNQENTWREKHRMIFPSSSSSSAASFAASSKRCCGSSVVLISQPDHFEEKNQRGQYHHHLLFDPNIKSSLPERLSDTRTSVFVFRRKK